MMVEKLDMEKRIRKSEIESSRPPDKEISNPKVLDYKVREFQIREILGHKTRNPRLQSYSLGD